MDQVNTDAWVGRAITDHGGIDQKIAAQLHATLGEIDAPAPQTGDLLPGLWHWCAFPPLTHVTDLSADGHPRGGALLPPMHLPRRMWAGGSLRFHAPLRVGDTFVRTTSVRSITPKTGRTGPMVMVTLDHLISGPRGLAIEERQDIVYLPMPTRYTPPRKQAMTHPVIRSVPMEPPVLFRYSALTFNAHRIHYDLDYTRNVEHYPGLVVHGPLQATLLMQAACTARGRPPESFDFRSVHPLFAGTDVDVAMAEEDGALNLWTGQSDHQGMQATAIWDGTL